jgi:AraC-like DNA-binding protein
MAAENAPAVPVAAPWPPPDPGPGPAAACAWRWVTAARWRTGPDWRLDRWRFPDTWIALPVGCAWRVDAGRPLRVADGDALVIPAGRRFTATYGPGPRIGTVWVLHADGGGAWGPAVLRGVRAGVAPWLAAACHDPRLADHLATRLLLDAAAAGLLAPGPEPAEPPALTALRRTIIGRLGDPGLDLPALAAAAGCSPGHLRRLCARHLGRGPHDLLVEARIDAACRLLRDDPALAVGTVAARVGFLSPSRFHAVFRARIGHPPDAWRRGG